MHFVGPTEALFFDRRIWHARSPNYSEHTRKAVFFGYTYRWTAIRDDIAPMRASDWFAPADLDVGAVDAEQVQEQARHQVAKRCPSWRVLAGQLHTGSTAARNRTGDGP